MTYTNVDTQAKATRAAGDLLGRIEVAMIKQAVNRLPAMAVTDDQREWQVIRTVYDKSYPSSWTTIVLGRLDIAGALPTTPTATNPTDAQIDTHVVAAWADFIKSR